MGIGHGIHGRPLCGGHVVNVRTDEANAAAREHIAVIQSHRQRAEAGDRRVGRRRPRSEVGIEQLDRLRFRIGIAIRRTFVGERHSIGQQHQILPVKRADHIAGQSPGPRDERRRRWRRCEDDVAQKSSVTRRRTAAGRCRPGQDVCPRGELKRVLGPACLGANVVRVNSVGVEFQIKLVCLSQRFPVERHRAGTHDGCLQDG
jgi:hypothetical protein